MSDPREMIIENGESVPTRLPIPTEKQARRTQKRVLPKLLRVASHIPFARDAAAAYFCTMDPATPRRAKLILMAALGYFVLPTDAIPDVLAGLGFADDATVLATALGLVGLQVKPAHRLAADRLLGLKQETDRNVRS